MEESQKQNSPIENQDIEDHDSRLKEHLKKRAYHNLLLASIGILLIIGMLLLFGTKLLIWFSTTIGTFSGDDTTTQKQEVSIDYIAPPQLDTPVRATNSGMLTISGKASDDTTIHLFRNERYIDKTTVKKDGSFTFSSVTLQTGENVIKAKAVQDNNESAFSQAVAVTVLNNPPRLTIETPEDGKVYDRGAVKVTGRTDEHVKVTVNGSRAIVDGRGDYTYSYKVKEGENKITIVATDAAGNESKKEITIKGD